MSRIPAGKAARVAFLWLFLWMVALAAGLGQAWGAASDASPERPRAPKASGPRHGVKCDCCIADEIWKGFLEHLRALGREDLIPPEVAVEPRSEAAEDEAAGQDQAEEAEAGVKKPAKVDLQANDPIRGLLFRLSKELVNLDAMFQEAPLRDAGHELKEAGESGAAGDEGEKARGLAASLQSGSDPFLKAYGDYYAARLDVEAGKYESAVKSLEGLLGSRHFLPRREVRRCLATAYHGLGDDTLALLEIQFFLVDLPVEREGERVWGEEELRKLREAKHPGPLHDSEASMRLITTLLAGVEVGQPTLKKERRVEDILEKTARLLEKIGGT